MHIQCDIINKFTENSLIDGLGGDGGTAGLGGKLLHGRPIFEGGLIPDGFGSVIFYVYTHCYITLKHANEGLIKLKEKYNIHKKIKILKYRYTLLYFNRILVE